MKKNIDLYEVDKEAFYSFVSQLKTDFFESFVSSDNEVKSIIHKLSGKTYCEIRGDKYYIYNFPEDNEWNPPQAVKRVELTTTQQVQEFLDVLGELQKNGRNF